MCSLAAAEGPNRPHGRRTSRLASRRSSRADPEPLDAAAEKEPLVEASGTGSKWLFSFLGDEPVQVSAAIGARVRNVALGVTGALIALGVGATPGEGTCDNYWVVDDVE
eukprot:7388242-Prymnesium_polylepis.1